MLAETKKCMICFDGTGDLVNPHQSNGGVGHLVHHECLLDWMQVSPSVKCPICHRQLNRWDPEQCLVRAAAKNNFDLISKLDFSLIPCKSIITALLTAADNHNPEAFDLIVSMLDDTIPMATVLPGFFETICGKQVHWLSITMLDKLVKSQGVAVDYDAALANAANSGNAEIFDHLLKTARAEIHNLGQCVRNVILSRNMEIVSLLVSDWLSDPEVSGEAVLAGCSSGQLRMLQVLVEDGAWKPHEDAPERSSLYLCSAAKSGLLDVVRYILQFVRSTSINVDWFPSVCENGHIQVAKLLLDKLPSINLQDGENTKSLGLAAAGGHLELVKLLHGRGASVTANGNLGLRLASKNGHLETMRYLVENGANIHAGDDHAVRLASKHGHLEVVKYLVANGENYKALDGFALREAQKNHHAHVVDYLLSLA